MLLARPGSHGVHRQPPFIGVQAAILVGIVFFQQRGHIQSCLTIAWLDPLGPGRVTLATTSPLILVKRRSRLLQFFRFQAAVAVGIKSLENLLSICS